MLGLMSVWMLVELLDVWKVAKLERGMVEMLAESLAASLGGT